MSDTPTNEAVLEAQPVLVHMQRFCSSRTWLERVQGAMGGIAPTVTHPSTCCFGHFATLGGGPGTTKQRLWRIVELAVVRRFYDALAGLLLASRAPCAAQEAAGLMRALQPASAIEPALRQLAEVWIQRWPFPSTASPDAALTVHGVRRLILDALPPRVSREVTSPQH